MGSDPERRRKKSRLTEFLPRQPRNNFFGVLGILQNHGVQISAKRGFDCRYKFSVHIDLRDEGTDNRVAKTFGIIKSFQDGLRTLGESFAFGVELAQNFEARSLFREGAL